VAFAGKAAGSSDLNLVMAGPHYAAALKRWGHLTLKDAALFAAEEATDAAGAEDHAAEIDDLHSDILSESAMQSPIPFRWDNSIGDYSKGYYGSDSEAYGDEDAEDDTRDDWGDDGTDDGGDGGMMMAGMMVAPRMVAMLISVIYLTFVWFGMFPHYTAV